MTTFAGSSFENVNQTAEKLLLILEYFAACPYPMRLQDVAKHFQSPAPTILRYLNTLVSRQYLYQNQENLRYALTWKICSIGRTVNSNLSLRNICSPYLNKLANQFSCGVCLVVRNELESIYLDMLDSPNLACKTLRRIGKSAPMHSTGSGKVLMSGLTSSEFDQYIDNYGLQGLTKNTITEKHLMLDELARIRMQGYAFDDEECEEDIRCLSVPLYSYLGLPTAAISVFNCCEVMTKEVMFDDILPALMNYSSEISSYLGYTGTPANDRVNKSQ